MPGRAPEPRFRRARKHGRAIPVDGGAARRHVIRHARWRSTSRHPGWWAAVSPVVKGCGLRDAGLPGGHVRERADGCPAMASAVAFAMVWRDAASARHRANGSGQERCGGKPYVTAMEIREPRASTHRWWCKRLGAPENQPVRHDACGERRQACAGRMRGQRFVLERSSAVWRGRRFSIRAGGHGAGIAKIRSGLRSVAVQGRTWGRSHAPRLCPAASALSPAAVTRSTRVAAALQKNKPSGRFTSVHPDATLRSSHGCPCARPPLPLMGDGGQPERRST